MRGAKYTPPTGDEKATEPVQHKVHARTKKGQFQADDPDTPDVNEAWVETKE